MSYPTSQPLLELDNISLAFKGVKAISNISFAVADGEICALIGPNGAGKSSLLNVINGVYRPQEGQIRFDRVERPRMRPHQAAELGIARTFQNIALFRSLSVLDNVLTGRNLRRQGHWLGQALRTPGAAAEEDRQREAAERVIEFLRLQPWRDAVVGRLPYGLQKRVELARALAAEPRLLLLDEPMAGMNAGEKREMSRFIVETNREFGTTVVLIEHDIGVVMGISDHVVVLDYGRKIGDGPPDAVRRDPEVIAAYLGTRH
ncbi:ABC transporter, ATP binding component [Azotobacter vinelandii CA]|uniref:ABC transporter, ATP binding component n=2 Tax=Azotobacter vinelandii TaxID=354 RepID=C1DFS9_AZOVD|nr:ABC transporter ATP-binding protein [Azotobacter vinelandii]ACO80475.1 ABC transporter, ATP binding component [Azotobacter vinelandii DJ]AGK15987.1 ABC transporter, ATP binding component [Azotobacter vinelandii CA]AGK21935.1 ABC transporter, ATP binding component [Azotobacter vinelandii CA6]WKN21244.1 ABC transporter ATP-binding protein [Azotobacter vinelandii]SFX35194.1 amino acid/amide ABC transporter ATP-binding protein 1, HAAT family [Azotobacter vinelandii]